MVACSRSRKGRLLCAAGIRIAIDEAGSGFANPSQDLGPHARPVLFTFADSMGAMLVAEGIETSSVHAQLMTLGVRHAKAT